MILKSTIRANILQFGITGLPYSGKSTLLKSLLDLDTHRMKAASTVHGLACYEAVLNKNPISGQYTWQCGLTKLDAELQAITTALAQACLARDEMPSFSWDSSRLSSDIGSAFGDPRIDSHFQKVLKSLEHIVNSLKLKGESGELIASTLTFVNVWDIGVNKAVFEFLSALATHHRRLLLVNVLNLERDAERLHERLHLDDTTLYRGEYRERGDEKTVMQLHTSLYYYGQYVAVASSAQPDTPDIAVLVGTHCDLLTDTQREINRTRTLQSLKGALDGMGASAAVYPALLAVDARSKKDAQRVRQVLESLIDKDRRFEMDIPLHWIFLRCVLQSMDELYMPRGRFVIIAKKCGLLDSSEVEEWLRLFQSCGSIIYLPSKSAPSPRDYVILNPVAFVRGLDKLYYLEQERNTTHEIICHLETAPKGLVTRNLAVALWSEDVDCYLDTLQKIGILAPISGLVSEDSTFGQPSPCYFMPTLRPGISQLGYTAESLFVQFPSEMPFHIQSGVLVQLLTVLQGRIEFVPGDCYNQLKFQWKDEEFSANVNLQFTEELCEVSFTSLVPAKVALRLRFCSVLKSACVSVFSSVLPTEPCQLALACPNGGREGRKTHLIRFHALQTSCEVYCHDCGQSVSMTGTGVDWIRGGYEGPVGAVLGEIGVCTCVYVCVCVCVCVCNVHACKCVLRSLSVPPTVDVVTHVQLTTIVSHLSHWSYSDIGRLALTLGLSMSEIPARANRSSMEELLLLLLLEWKQRYTYAVCWDFE